MNTPQRPARQRLSEHTRRLVESYFAEGPQAHHLDDQRRLPTPDRIVTLVDLLFALLYPGCYGNRHLTRENVAFHVGALLDDLAADLHELVQQALGSVCGQEPPCPHCSGRADEVVESFIAALPETRLLLVEDSQAALDGDPAARNLTEILLAYPGLEAITVHRLAHLLHQLEVPLLPRMLAEWAHRRTGVDIHPGARIGRRFFIDHGTGVVVGETTVIGDGVKLYQGVTLGALSFPKDEGGQLIRGARRHPTIEDGVVIYAGATILGGETVIGKGAVIGGNTWVTHSIPSGGRVINTPQEQRVESGRPIS